MGYLIVDYCDVAYTADDIVKAIEVIREGIPSVYDTSREASIALTKLDECEMWLERAIIRSDEVPSGRKEVSDGQPA